MKIVRVIMGKFFTFQNHLVDFPDGLTLFVGPNGSGKTSASVEAAAWALWGETVRGSDPGPDGDVTVETVEDEGTKNEARVVVSRVRAKKKTELTIAIQGCDASGQTPTETQARINQVFGDWRRHAATRVFSRSLLSRFSDATAKERSTLLEGILGLEQFERAAVVARKVRGERKTSLDGARSRVNEAMAALARSREAGRAQEPPRPTATIEADIANHALAMAASRASLVKLTPKVARAETAVRAGESEWARRRATAADLERRAAALRSRAAGAGNLKDCPVCLRPVSVNDRHAIQQHYEDEEAPLDVERRKLLAEMEILETDNEDQAKTMNDMRKTREAMEEDLRGFERIVSVLETELAVAMSQEQQAAKVVAMVARDEAAVEVAAEVQAAAEAALKIADAAVEVLGPRGARVKLFDGALVRLQQETNRVLAHLGMDLRIELSNRRTQASGKEVDEVSMKVDGAGAGTYSGASDGERRRVDIALLLALSRMAREGGAIFFDEVFDTLDDEGLERVADLLQEIARTRQVLVTSHSNALVSLLPAASVRRVEKVDGVSMVSG